MTVIDDAINNAINGVSTPDTVTDHMDGTFSIDWCGGKISRMDATSLKDLYETIGVLVEDLDERIKENP